ncbi:MAG: glycoside hydrolase family 3 N-terminal domain-containing protein, partial [Candidatus Izemoplasmatales bacterium]|nr:glycoside hydrolase family 3 N-terminal domain-containing protein [Candidatus Izemoplasmatales bacterium]
TYKVAGISDEYSSHGGTVIAVITRESGEGVDISWNNSDGVDGSYLTLTVNELDILVQLAEKKRLGEIDKIVVLINSAVTVQCDFLFNDSYRIDAAIWIGLPGATGMNAVAKALIGEINPSGRLSDTFLKDNFSSPAAMYWRENDGFSSEYANVTELELNNSQMYYGVYVEGVYVGYRYYETRYEDFVMKSAGVGEYDYDQDVAYPFGYGLSYTDFTYSDLTVTEEKDTNNKTMSYNVSVKVTNSGTVAGKEVVQVYLQKPYSDYARLYGVEVPSVELVGFGKTSLLQPGEFETLSATIADEKNMERMRVAFEQFRLYDSQNAQTYILNEGDYYLTVAKDSHDAINNILAAKGYTTTNSPMDSAGDATLVSKVLTQPTVDAEVFSTSSAEQFDSPDTLSSTEIGTEIVNQLDYMDPNRFSGVTNDASEDGDVVYVTRNNWLGTLPSGETTLSLTNTVEEKYDITSHKTIIEYEDAIMPTFSDMSSNLTLAMMNGLSYADPQWNLLLNKISQDDMFLVLTNCYGYTPALPSVAKPLTDEDDGPYGISNTTEGFSSMSCQGIIASTFNLEIYDLVGEAIAADGRSGHDATQKNLHGLYAPGLNMHRVAFGGRASEYYSEDPFLSGIAAIYEIQAMQAQGVVAHPKHFIFNDEESNRNGIGIWMNEQAAREIYLLPWEYALRSDMGNAHALMTSFNRAGCLWTSANDNLMMNILRDEWCFDGYTLTDMAGSNGKLFMVYDDGFMNGTDCFLDKGTLSGFTSDIKNSPSFNINLRESMHRLLYVVANHSAALDGYSNLTRLQPVVVWWKALITTFTVVFIVGTITSAGMYVLSDLDQRRNIFRIK